MKIILFVFLCWTGIFTAVFVLASEKIDINTATQEELIKITHIGNVRALELISLRPFASLDDLVRIRGISEKRVADIKKQGLAMAGEGYIPTAEQKQEPEMATTEIEIETAILESRITESENKIMENKKGSILPVYLTAAFIALFSGAAVFQLKNNWA